MKELHHLGENSALAIEKALAGITALAQTPL
jgi:hypothetical protein